MPLFRHVKGPKTQLPHVFRFWPNLSQERDIWSWKWLQEATSKGCGHEDHQGVSGEPSAVTAGVQGPRGSWAYLHERCLHLSIRGLFSGSSGSKKCTAGRQAASTSPSPSPLLDKPEKTSSGQCWVSAVLPHLPTHSLQQQNQGSPCQKAQDSS